MDNNHNTKLYSQGCTTFCMKSDFKSDTTVHPTKTDHNSDTEDLLRRHRLR